MPHMGLILSSAKSTQTGEEDQEMNGVSAPLGCFLYRIILSNINKK